MPQNSDNVRTTSNRGFASMDNARQREIASQGGRAAHEKGTAHQFTSEEARVAGRKGGQVVSQDRQHMAMIGREGGLARSQRQKALQEQKSAQSRSGAANEDTSKESDSHEKRQAARQDN